MSVRFSRDERAVSEVIGYLLGFFMSFVLLLLTLTAFQYIVDDRNDEATHTHFQDVANRVSAGVLAAAEVGTQRANGDTTAQSQDLFFELRVRVPSQIRGEPYHVSLTEERVTVSGGLRGISETGELFNLQVGCGSSIYPVCQMTGEATSTDGIILIKYEYKRTGASATCSSVPVNCITVASE